MILGTNVFAQTTVKAVLVENSTENPVSFATVSLTPKGSTAVYKYTLSSDNGSVVFDKVKHGDYTFKAELMGLQSYTKEISVKASVDLGTIRMMDDTQLLDAAKVSAIGSEVTIKKDTIEYNATAFKTTENDVLEDLLKKLPGVEVSEDGSVTFNGETIKKITISGKTFFLDDPQLATKNIPAKIVNKVKVFEKKSDQAMFTGIDDGNEETVIDLSFKPGMMKGAFGNIMGGGGHDLPAESSKYDDHRYQAAAFVGNFTEDKQISGVLNVNNTNNRGFNDLSGSMMGGMRGGGGGGMGGRQGGWGRQNGITTSYMGGVNGAWTLFDGDMDLSSNYLYSGTQKDVLENSKKTTYLDGRNLVYDSDGYARTNTFGHRFGVRLDHKFSEKTSILFEPQLNFGTGNFNQFSKFETTTDYMNGQKDLTNNGFDLSLGNNKNITTNGFLLFRQRLNKPGRTVSAHIFYRFSNNDLEGYNQSITNNFIASGISDFDLINQRFEQNQKSATVNTRLTYTEPITDKFFAEANYSYSFNRSTSYKDTYDSPTNEGFNNDEPVYNPAGETKNITYSNRILNKADNHSAGLSLVYQLDKVRAQIGLNASPTYTYNETTKSGIKDTYESNVLRWSPHGMLFYEASESINIKLFYHGHSTQPDVNKLMPVPDNSNPLNIAFGNPSLLPYFDNHLRGDIKYNNKQKFITFNIRLEGGYITDPIVQASWYGNNGVQYSMPYNGPASTSFNTRMFSTIPIAKTNFTINEIFRVSYAHSGSYIGSGIDTEKYYTEGEMDYSSFLEDFGDISKSPFFQTNYTTSLSIMERLRIAYKLDNFELRASGRTMCNQAWYTVATYSKPTTWNNQLDASATWTLEDPGMTFKAEYNYNWYRGYTTPQDDEHILNAEISKLLFKKKFTLAAKMYDVLNQSKNLSISDSENYHLETLNNTLGRYIIISLTYRFGNFDKSKMKGGMPGMPGGHGPRR